MDTSETDYDEQAEKLKEALKPKLTIEFLAILVEAARTIGWGVDYTEVESFVKEVFGIAGKDIPNLEPYQNP